MGRKNVPKVGVALLAYNQGKYIDDAIESLKKQTFQDFEVILADDGSDDDYTPEKLRSIRYEKITTKIIDNKNLGNAKRRKKLYEAMNNEYVLDFSGDDVLAPTFLEKTVKYMEDHKDCGAVSVNINYFKKKPKDAYFLSKYDEKKMVLPYVLARNHVLGSSLMRAKALEETDLSGGFVRYQDWDRWISMMEKGWNIGLVKEPLFYYRQDSNSLSHAAKISDEMEIRRKLLAKHKESYKKYYDEVIMDMEYAFLEMKESKDWLDGEYHKLIAENLTLRDRIKTLEQENIKLSEDLAELLGSRAMKMWLKIRKK